MKGKRPHSYVSISGIYGYGVMATIRNVLGYIREWKRYMGLNVSDDGREYG